MKERRERPILFSAPMVRAILEGRKTQTRRILKPQPPEGTTEVVLHERNRDEVGCFDSDTTCLQVVKCPHGAPGDRLWVRETWADVNTGDGPAIAYRADGDVRTWHEFSKTFGPNYGAGPSMDYEAYPGKYSMWFEDLFAGASGHSWRPSIFMPRWASRITLEITNVRVERLQEISGTDALAEGCSHDLFCELLLPSAVKCEEKPEYWVHGGNEGLSYCEDCCQKEVERLRQENPEKEFERDGGWGIEGDSTPFCETCSCRLSNSLTDYGAEEEFKHFLEHGCDLKSPDDCCSLLSAVQSQLWLAPDFPGDSDWQKKRTRERHDLMHRLAYRVLWESINGPGSWEKNPWVWVLDFRRLE